MGLAVGFFFDCVKIPLFLPIVGGRGGRRGGGRRGGRPGARPGVVGGKRGGPPPPPPLPFGSFPEEPRQGVHRLFQPLQMQLVFRAAAEALG